MQKLKKTYIAQFGQILSGTKFCVEQLKFIVYVVEPETSQKEEVELNISLIFIPVAKSISLKIN